MTSTETPTTAATGNKVYSYGKAVGISAISLVLFAVVIVLCSAADATSPPWVINMAIALLGVCTGWLIGAVVSPYDNKEVDEFSKYIKVISTFGSLDL